MTETGKEKQVGEPGKILIVDDNEELLGAISRLLKLQGHSTLTALSGEEALEIARKESPDLILLDWILPGIDGIEPVNWLVERATDLQLITVTGFTPHYVELAKKLGVAKGLQSVTTLHKPMRLSALRDALTYDD